MLLLLVTALISISAPFSQTGHGNSVKNFSASELPDFYILLLPAPFEFIDHTVIKKINLDSKGFYARNDGPKISGVFLFCIYLLNLDYKDHLKKISDLYST